MNPKLQIIPGGKINLPVLPLRDVVIYPSMAVSLFVGRPQSRNALDAAMDNNRTILMLTQRKPDINDPTPDDLFRVGTIANLMQSIKLPDGSLKVLASGTQRARVVDLKTEQLYMSATVKAIPEQEVSKEDSEIIAMMRSITSLFERFAANHQKDFNDVSSLLREATDPIKFTYITAEYLPVKLELKQQMLEIEDVKVRMERLLAILEEEIDLLKVEKRIHGRIREQMEKSQREYYLSEQMKAIQKEMGEASPGGADELQKLAKKITDAKMPKHAREVAEAEIKKLRMMPPMAAEATVVRNYLDTLINAPWNKTDRLSRDIVKARKILEEDHYGLEKVKERILEFLAVQRRIKKLQGTVLCLVGPPGVGKTSIGKSIARATKRKFTRMSLGGVRDEADIRGHRRTYIGSMPGRIIQNLSRAQSRNPLFMLDEIDKMAMDFRGDPAAALLEVLDPEQNCVFNDHYLEVDFDLSETMFIATANTLNLPPALLDRLEIIRISGYTELEKTEIAKRFLWPRTLERTGLHEKEIELDDRVIHALIRLYTREAGVRNLERELARIARKVVKEIELKEKKAPVAVDEGNLAKYLGVARFKYDLAKEKNRIGEVTGLSWTEAGGDLLTIEAASVPGKGKMMQTGNLGAVMKESMRAALTVLRNRAASLGLEADFHEYCDLHVHVPEGATPKDGPSAGVAVCVALVSALTNIEVHADVAMTGEITLRGEVLPVGGLKEKLLAAHRGGIKTVLIPRENVKNLEDIPETILKELEIKDVQWIDEVFQFALTSLPLPLQDKAGSTTKTGKAVTPPKPAPKRPRSSTKETTQH